MLNLRTHRGFLLFSTVLFGVVMSLVMYQFMVQVNNDPLPLPFLIYLVLVSFLGGVAAGEGAWRILNWYFGDFKEK